MNNDQEQEYEYDVVLDALTVKHDALMSMTMKNMNSEFMDMGIIDDIRLYQCEQLKKAMRMWRTWVRQNEEQQRMEKSVECMCGICKLEPPG